MRPGAGLLQLDYAAPRWGAPRGASSLLAARIVTRGRLFTGQDRDRPVAVVTARTASRLGPADPIGQRFLPGKRPGPLSRTRWAGSSPTLGSSSSTSTPAASSTSRTRSSHHRTPPWSGVTLRRTSPRPSRTEGWLAVLGGPLYGVQHRRGLPVIGYVKTHHRSMLAREHCVKVPELTAGKRSRLFAMGERSLRPLRARGRPGAVGGLLREHRPPRDAVRPWPRCRGRRGRARAWPATLLRLGSASGRAGSAEPDAGRGLAKRHLHRLTDDARFPSRAVREAMLERNREGRTA